MNRVLREQMASSVPHAPLGSALRLKENVLKPLRAACGMGPSMNRVLREQMASSVRMLR